MYFVGLTLLWHTLRLFQFLMILRWVHFIIICMSLKQLMYLEDYLHISYLDASLLGMLCLFLPLLQDLSNVLLLELVNNLLIMQKWALLLFLGLISRLLWVDYLLLHHNQFLLGICFCFLHSRILLLWDLVVLCHFTK